MREITLLHHNPAKGGTKCEEKIQSIMSTSTIIRLRQDYGGQAISMIS